MEKRPSGLCDTEHRRLLGMMHQVKPLELGMSMFCSGEMCLHISNVFVSRCARQPKGGGQ